MHQRSAEMQSLISDSLLPANAADADSRRIATSGSTRLVPRTALLVHLLALERWIVDQASAIAHVYEAQH